MLYYRPQLNAKESELDTLPFPRLWNVKTLTRPANRLAGLLLFAGALTLLACTSAALPSVSKLPRTPACRKASSSRSKSPAT